MFQRKPSRFRRRSNGRGHRQRGGGLGQARLRTKPFSNGHGQQRNNFRPFLSAEKLFEKYNSLAKEALSSGDKTLSENYLQHADHFMRIIEDKNKNRNQMKSNMDDQIKEENKSLSDSVSINQNKETENKT